MAPSPRLGLRSTLQTREKWAKLRRARLRATPLRPTCGREKRSTTVRVPHVNPGGSETLLKSGGRISYAQDSVILEDLITTIVARAKASREEAAP